MMDKLKQAPARWSRAAPSLPNWLNAYGDFVTKNAGSVSQIESALRSLTYIIPGEYLTCLTLTLGSC